MIKLSGLCVWLQCKVVGLRGVCAHTSARGETPRRVAQKRSRFQSELEEHGADQREAGQCAVSIVPQRQVNTQIGAHDPLPLTQRGQVK